MSEGTELTVLILTSGVATELAAGGVYMQVHILHNLHKAKCPPLQSFRSSFELRKWLGHSTKKKKRTTKASPGRYYYSFLTGREGCITNVTP